MLYRIRFICEEVEDFMREFKIDSDATFLELNQAILDACDWEDGQMTSFYICDDEWHEGEQITREDFRDDYNDNIYVMADTRLSSLIDGEGCRMMYVFDPFNDRRFQGIVKEEILGESLDKPELLHRRKVAPTQIADLDLSDEALLRGVNLSSSDDDDDEYDPYGIGGDTFNSDELDFEGFEIGDQY